MRGARLDGRSGFIFLDSDGNLIGLALEGACCFGFFGSLMRWNWAATLDAI
jgi:hypothetical protein